MKIQEDLVFDKTGHQLLGFVNLGDVNSDLKALETQINDDTATSENIATHVLTLMIRGIFIKFEFPYASFPTQGNEIHLGRCNSEFIFTTSCRCNWAKSLLDILGSR